MNKYDKSRQRIIVCKDMLKAGYSIMIAHLNREYADDEKVEVEDIVRTETVLRFSDKGSVEKMIEVLSIIRDEWGDDDV